jgi:hypothetical protein
MIRVLNIAIWTLIPLVSLVQNCWSQPSRQQFIDKVTYQSRVHSVADSVISGHDSLISRIQSEIRPDSLRVTVQHLQDFGTRYALAANRDSVWQWIRSRFVSMGFSDVAVDSFWISQPRFPVSTWQKNVTATLPGRVLPDRIIILGAHYDSQCGGNPMVSAPGADDNGSGTAAVLEIARALKQSGYEPQSTIKFVAFAAEELGVFGSEDYSWKARVSRMGIRLMVNLDVVSYSTTTGRQQGQVEIDVGDTSPWDVGVLKTTIHKFSVLTPVYMTGAGPSDDQEFNRNGIPSVGFLEYPNGPYHHTTKDIVSNCNYEYCVEVTRAACAIALTFADKGSKVSNLDVSSGYADGATVLMLRWSLDKNLDAKFFRIYLGKESGSYERIATTADTVFVIRDVDENVRWFAAVAPVDKQEIEGEPVETSFVPQEILPVPHRVIPLAFKLFNNYPNPFNGATLIQFDLPAAGFVSLKILDPLGRELATLVDQQLDGGQYSFQWDGTIFASGVYFYRLQAAGYAETKKMILLK